MLNTINGFDVLLVMIIMGLLWRVSYLNDECHDYVEQILKVSWELQDERKKNNNG
jgi:hypothetical protein